jgi:hypothetical protein
MLSLSKNDDGLLAQWVVSHNSRVESRYAERRPGGNRYSNSSNPLSRSTRSTRIYERVNEIIGFVWALVGANVESHCKHTPHCRHQRRQLGHSQCGRRSLRS